MRIKIQHLYFYIVLIFCFLGKSVIAQEVSFTTSVGAKVVGLTDNFEVSYTSNKQGKFIQPKFKNFKVVSAVSTGESNQISAINGKVSRTTTFSYKLYLQPKRIGTFTVEGAKIKVGKATYQSKPVKVKVVKESQVRQRPQSLIDQFLGGGGQQAQPVQITQEDMFVKLDVSNSQVFHNQPVVVNYNLYKAKYQCQIEGFEIPTYQDFLSDEIKLDQNKAPGKETINGIEYEVHTLKKIVLTPQKPGMLRVDPYKVQLRVHTGSFFGTSVVMESNPLEITVKELPKPIPAEFSNQVGKFEVAIVPFSTELEIDNPVTFKVVISGEGNLKQLGAPQINFPKSLEVYDPETASEINFNDSVLNGKVEFSYLIIPRKSGEHSIPSFAFTYFDLETKTYQTINSKPFKFMVKGNGAISENESDFDSDEANNESSEGKSGFNSWFIVIPCILGLLGLLAFVFLKKRKPMEETEEDRRRNARIKLAKKMAVAKSHLDNNNIDGFYDETLIGLNKYVNEKLQIQTSEMTKESIVNSLTNKGVIDTTVSKFIQVLEQCEMAKYAPLTSQNNLEIYEKSIDVIEEIEGQIK